VILYSRGKNLKHIGACLCALAVLALLSACGQKGDLYLPEEPNELVYASADGKEDLTRAFITDRRSR